MTRKKGTKKGKHKTYRRYLSSIEDGHNFIITEFEKQGKDTTELVKTLKALRDQSNK